MTGDYNPLPYLAADTRNVEYKTHVDNIIMPCKNKGALVLEKKTS